MTFILHVLAIITSVLISGRLLLLLEETFCHRLQFNLNNANVKLLNLQEEKWKTLTSNKPKLRFYNLFKNELKVENYVYYNLTASQRSIVAQFRLGILPLAVETGRFRGTDLENRICILCDRNEVEDEIHFLFNCPLYENLRTTWLKNIINKCPEFEMYDLQTKLCTLFEHFHRCTSKYLAQCYNTRKTMNSK